MKKQLLLVSMLFLTSAITLAAPKNIKRCQKIDFKDGSLFSHSISVNGKQIDSKTVQNKTKVKDCIESLNGSCYMSGVIEKKGKDQEVAFFDSGKTRDRALNQLKKSGICKKNKTI